MLGKNNRFYYLALERVDVAKPRPNLHTGTKFEEINWLISKSDSQRLAIIGQLSDYSHLIDRQTNHIMMIKH